MEMIVGFLMNKFGLAAVVAALGGLAYLYRAVKSSVDVRREQSARKAAETQADAARARAQTERQKRAAAEQTAAIERNRNDALSAQITTERAQKTREENISEQKSSDLVGNGLDHLFDMPAGGLPGGATGTDTGIDDAEK